MDKLLRNFIFIVAMFCLMVSSVWAGLDELNILGKGDEEITGDVIYGSYGEEGWKILPLVVYGKYTSTEAKTVTNNIPQEGTDKVKIQLQLQKEGVLKKATTSKVYIYPEKIQAALYVKDKPEFYEIINLTRVPFTKYYSVIIDISKLSVNDIFWAEVVEGDKVIKTRALKIGTRGKLTLDFSDDEVATGQFPNVAVTLTDEDEVLKDPAIEEKIIPVIALKKLADAIGDDLAQDLFNLQQNPQLEEFLSKAQVFPSDIEAVKCLLIDKDADGLMDTYKGRLPYGQVSAEERGVGESKIYELLDEYLKIGDLNDYANQYLAKFSASLPEGYTETYTEVFDQNNNKRCAPLGIDIKDYYNSIMQLYAEKDIVLTIADALSAALFNLVSPDAIKQVLESETDGADMLYITYFALTWKNSAGDLLINLPAYDFRKYGTDIKRYLAEKVLLEDGADAYRLVKEEFMAKLTNLADKTNSGSINTYTLLDSVFDLIVPISDGLGEEVIEGVLENLLANIVDSESAVYANFIAWLEEVNINIVLHQLQGLFDEANSWPDMIDNFLRLFNNAEELYPITTNDVLVFFKHFLPGLDITTIDPQKFEVNFSILLNYLGQMEWVGDGKIYYDNNSALFVFVKDPDDRNDVAFVLEQFSSEDVLEGILKETPLKLPNN